MKKLIKELIPPLMIKFIKRALKPKNTKIKFLTFEKASLACRKDAYQNTDLVGVVVQKNIAYKENLRINPIFDLDGLRILAAVGISLKENTFNVLDFGGGGGYHFTIAKAAFGPDLKMRWHVVETEAMTKGAQCLANDELNFFDNINAAKNSMSEIDLVFSSSTLQYCSDPLSSLRQLTELNASHLYITRTPFLNGQGQVITTQASKLSENGPGPLPKGFIDTPISYPIVYVSRYAVEEILREKYEIRFMTEEGEGVFGHGKELIKMTGYFCVRRDVPQS